MEVQEYWGGYPVLSPAGLPYPGIELGSPALLADSLPTELSGKVYVHSNTIYNIPQLGNLITSINRRKNKYIVRYSFNEMLHSNKE